MLLRAGLKSRSVELEIAEDNCDMGLYVVGRGNGGWSNISEEEDASVGLWEMLLSSRSLFRDSRALNSNCIASIASFSPKHQGVIMTAGIRTVRILIAKDR